MVNAVMDAIALLSSLATDLDIMLNDLRSSPGSRLLPPTHHLQQRSASNSSNASSPLTVGGGGGGGGGGVGGNGGLSGGGGQTTTGYLHSAWRNNHSNQFREQQQQQQRNAPQLQQEKRQQQQQQQSRQSALAHIIPAHTLTATTTTTTITTTACTTSIPQRYNRYQHQQKQPQAHRCCASAANACNQTRTRNATRATKIIETAAGGAKTTTTTASAKAATAATKTTSSSSSRTRNQQRLNQPATANRSIATSSAATTTTSTTTTTTTTTSGCSGCELVAIAGNVAPVDAAIGATDALHCNGLSAEVRRIEKLPLWSYQHKQLQQPQKLQVQLLQQQQRATKAFAVMHAATASTKTTTQVNVTTAAITTPATVATSNQDAVSRTHNLGDGRVLSATGNAISGGPYGGSIAGRVATAVTTSSVTTLNTASTADMMDYVRVEGNVVSGGGAVDDVFRMSWLPPTALFFGTSDSSQQLTTSAVPPATTQNQLKSITASSGGASTAGVSAGTACNSTNNNNNNNNNNTNNNNNCNSSNNASNRRLPFCGLDSIKGSDSNGHGDGCGGLSGGATNLCFDLQGGCTSSSVTAGLGTVNAVAGLGHLDAGGGGIGAGQHDNISEQFHSLDAADSSCCGDGQFEDDMQALLPKCKRLSGDELSQSRTSLVSSSDGGILAEGETSSETSRGTDECPPCDLGLMERLLLTHPVWFLPGIQRSGAVHFLQGKEEGNFIVRGSSQINTMAVSVRLPPDTGPYIEHYLIQSNNGILSLESSRFTFDSIPALIAHYAQCCDELPVQLILPRALREVKNRQQLSSLALLGQEFWRYPMSCPKPHESEATLLDAKSPNSLTETSGLGTTVFSSNSSAPQPAKVFSPTNNLGGLFSQAGTPSDTTSSMSSFSTSGAPHLQLMSPESVDSVMLTMSPVDMNNHRNGIGGLACDATPTSANGNLSTFKSNNLVLVPTKGIKASDNGIRPQRPKPPNTLNLDLRKPPAPPLRCFKPLTPSSPLPSDHASNSANNFTVTTTVTFSMENNNSPQFVEVTTPATATNMIASSALNSNATFQTFSKRLSPEGECKDTLSSQGSSNGSRWQSQSSKDSNHSQRKILSPCSAGTPTSVLGSSSSKSRRAKARKESKHYQESDILESPQIYCRSALGDKISDYEDLWTQESNERTGLLSSFKPAEGAQATITSLSANLLSPANSSVASVSLPHNCEPSPTPTADAPSCDTQQLIQFSADALPRSRAGLLLPGLMSQSLSEEQFKICEPNEGDTTPTADTPASRSKQGSPFYAEPADALREAGLTTASILRRSQRGPLLPANHRHSEPPKSGFARTPICPLLIPKEFEKIAGSLDELKKKQQQPAEQQASTQPQQQQPTKRARARFEQWQLDSSWEFMGKQDEDDDYDDDANEHAASSNYGDYDTAEQWRQHPAGAQEKENSLGREANKENKQKPLTVHQIIAKRFPDLNLPELVRCSTPPQQTYLQQHQNGQIGQKLLSEHHGSQKSFDSQTGSRLSSYDNVGGTYSFCQSFFNGIDSAQSDDGTVFSEPWDSSQWDSINPQDDTTIASDTIHFSKCRPVVSEDDTIIEELSTKESCQDTLKAKKCNGRQKVATILRNPSMRDREILRHPRNKLNAHTGGPGDLVRACTLQLAQDQSSTFARNVENFISCTKESREAAPQVVMRNMRQFMNGMKNYLVKHGEGKFHQEVEAARSRLKADEFLNLDAILETVMHQLVVLPLREHLYSMFVDYYKRSEDIQLLAQNVKYACGRSATDFGIRATVTPPSSTSLQIISALLQRLQEAELPLDKLELFLCVISTIFEATGCQRGQQLGADDFLPVLVYVVAKCGFVGAEIEAEFMWGLLQPTLLSGEAGYYLTALCSAVHVLKSFMASENENGTGSLDWRSSSLPACSSVLRVIIPDECNGSLQTRTLPVRPHTTTREVCRIIAHKARITNPQDYALFKLVDGEETLLNDVECPQDVRFSSKGKHCMLAYKRIDAKIAWPTATY
ncbi:protein sprint isoform X2 [Rhagoletis pomonella]|uniref:protein sprint isoform X2 n=1 Tax=Rhagoletis pomonella TaxID=28610 RepID=UPI00177B1125|nr:protein sprint isoform X2 [Rhagoletis pomonella]